MNEEETSPKGAGFFVGVYSCEKGDDYEGCSLGLSKRYAFLS